jgi:hypothetical protein
MARRVVESLHGVGEIYTGNVLLRSTAYELTVFQDDDPLAAAGALHIDGHIDISGIAEAVVLAGPQDLRLRLEDGRQLQFELTDTGGHITGKSGPQPAPEH